MPETNNNLPNEEINKGAKTPKSGLKTLATAVALAISLLGSPEANAVTPNDEAKTELATALQSSPEDDNDKLISKEEMTIKFIKNNVSINGQSVKDLNIIHFKDDQYRITKYLPEHDTPLDIYITFTYKDNNILISKVEPEQYKEEGQFINPYGYLLSYQKNNKNVDIRIVPNPNAGKQIIQDQEKNNKISTESARFKHNPKFLNTQLTELNNLKLGKEIFEEGNNYYKEVFAVVNGKYVKIFKVYFDEKGNIDIQKTRQEIKNVKILGIDVYFTIDDTGKISLDLTSIKDIENRLAEDRAILTNLLNNPNIASDKDFPGLHKTDGQQSIEGDIFSIYDIENRIYSAKIATNLMILIKIDGETPTLVDCYGHSIEQINANINGHGYSIKISNNQLILNEKREFKEVTSNELPKFTGNQKISNILNNKENNISITNYNIQIWNKDGNLISEIPTTTEEGKTKISEKYSTKLNVLDFCFHYSKFEGITNQIKVLADKLGLTELDIKAALESQLQNEGIDLTQQNTIKVSDNNSGDIFYCTIKHNQQKNIIEIVINDKLEKIMEKMINNLLNMYKIIDKAGSGKLIKRYNKENYEDMSKYAIGQSGGNGLTILHDDIINFTSGNTNNITVSWLIEGQDIKFTINQNGRIIGSTYIIIGGQKFKPVKFDGNWILQRYPSED